MKKQLTEKIVYEPRSGVKVAVTNAPVPDPEGGPTQYKRKVTLTVDLGISLDKVSFKDGDEMGDFFGNVGFEDPQTSLLGNKE